MTLAAGSRLGPYEVLAPLGAGGMGEVYRARDTRLSREVAIKVLPSEVAADTERLKRFEKEARAASSLNHPSIVTIYEIGRSDSVSYIAMELVEGKTLRELLAGGPLPIKRLLLLGTQLAEGLARAHDAGIVHRDLKPENVMVTKDGLVKILDFGLAKLTRAGAVGEGETDLPTQTATGPGVVMGTVGYMSPEQASGHPLDFRSDQFALGSVLYEMATGKRAFQAKTAVETLSAILREEPEPIGSVNPQVPVPLRWIIERCLAKDPEERYASTKDLARELSIVRDRLSEASWSGTGLSGPLPRARARLRTLAALSAVAVALAAVYLLGQRTGKSKTASTPAFHRLTFRRGVLGNACFAPDGQTIVYSAAWEGGDRQIYSTRLDSPESRPLGLGEADIVSISSTGEMAVVLHPAKGQGAMGTLARVPLAGGAPREILENINMLNADWSPDGKALSVVRTVGVMSRLEYPIGKVLLETRSSLFTPRISPTGDRIVFWEGENLSVIDSSGKGKKILSSGLEQDNGGVPSWTADGKEIWFTAVEPGHLPALYAVDMAGKRRLVTRVPGGLELHGISREGRVLLEHHTLLFLLMGVGPGEGKERDLSWLDGSSPSDLSADGRTLVITEVLDGGGPRNAIYLRTTDGSPAKRLGEGRGMTLSPDGKWLAAASVADGKPNRLTLLPTGAGEPKTLEFEGLERIGFANWLLDGKRLLFSGSESGHGERLYVQEISGGKPLAITAEGVGLRDHGNSVSPDGKSVIGLAGRHWTRGEWRIYPIAGGDSRPIRGLEPGDIPFQWSADSRSLYVSRREPKVWLLDPETGLKRPWREIRPPDPSIDFIPVMLVTPDGKSYAYFAMHLLSELYLVDGLK